MLFNSFQYWIFFLIVAVLFYSMPFKVGKVLLLLASYMFYMWWDPRFIVLILTSTIVDYYLGMLLEAATGRRKRLLLAVSLVVNLGILGFFKYYDFFAGSLAFDQPRWYDRILHNETAYAIQRQIKSFGLAMLVLPMLVKRQVRWPRPRRE